MIIGVLSQKGGVGKTTLAVNIADTFTRSDNRVLLVDADPQASALAWSSIREEPAPFPVIGMATPKLHVELPKLSENYDLTIIDGAPRANALGKSVIAASDVIIIPTQPSALDIWAARETLDLIEEARTFKPSLISVFAINRKIANTAIGRDLSEQINAIEGAYTLKTALHQRVSYAESIALGLTIFEYAPKSEASNEMVNLVMELVQLIEDEEERKQS